MTTTEETRFNRTVLKWYDKHGRKDLPWHANRDPYAIWLSEIMLQQTQVATVIPYYQKFMQRFPTIPALATANIDEVLHHWTGLGYYARARNLHKAAHQIMQQHNGEFPQSFDHVVALPGIGASTAGAILAFGFKQRHAILDGNVKRVLARYHAVDGWPGKRQVEQRLWQLAEQYTPSTRVADYTQAIMDLGATLCRRGQPQCQACPLARHCVALKQGNPGAYPTPKPAKTLPTRAVNMLIIRDQNQQVLLTRRPPVGIWGGLWSFPECMESDVKDWSRRALGLEIEAGKPWNTVHHSFSHFHLEIQPIPAKLLRPRAMVMEPNDSVWYNLQRPDERGLAAPISRLLQQLRTEK